MKTITHQTYVDTAPGRAKTAFDAVQRVDDRTGAPIRQDVGVFKRKKREPGHGGGSGFFAGIVKSDWSIIPC